MSHSVRRTALVLAAVSLTMALSACKTAARPFSRFVASGPPDGPACDPNRPATLRVSNQAGKPYEIHVSRRGTPRVWIARAPVGTTAVTVLGPTDYTARYTVVQRDKPVIESSVSWTHRTVREKGVELELQCAPVPKGTDKAL